MMHLVLIWTQNNTPAIHSCNITRFGQRPTCFFLILRLNEPFLPSKLQAQLQTVHPSPCCRLAAAARSQPRED